MELKRYQQNVIDDLEFFLQTLNNSHNVKQAFVDYWINHPRYPLTGDKVAPYHDKLDGVPSVCMKVPTAGGKTFLAVNALQPIFAARGLPGSHPRFVVWLVPSDAILSQTLTNLRTLAHPYCQKLMSHFGNNVTVLDKEQALMGEGLDSDGVLRGVSILVVTFDSLKIDKDKLKIFFENPHDKGLKRSKDMLRAYRENSNLAPFSVFNRNKSELEYTDPTALINVLRYMNPVVVVDESHNASTSLSYEMLSNLNPSFVLELTATPRENSNIISFVDANALHNEQMIKLPLMVSQQSNQDSVIMAALTLRRNLEDLAMAEYAKGGDYIRPIILFQAESRNKEDKTTFEKVKAKLVDLGVPEQQIAIKTSDYNELKNVDLLSPDCEIRFIITVNALKEGWDCPFAYILASLANKSSVVDVTQIVGRVLRQPYTRWHKNNVLNSSFVFTSSEKFHETLVSLETGLVHAGFSKTDYRIAEEVLLEGGTPIPEERELALSYPEIETFDGEGGADVFDGPFVGAVSSDIEEYVTKLSEQTIVAHTEFKAQSHQAVVAEAPPIDLQEKTMSYPIRPEFTGIMSNFFLPQFKVFLNNWLLDESKEILFDKSNLLEGFPLGKYDTNLNFDQIDEVVYTGDLKNEREIEFSPLKYQEKSELLELFTQQTSETQQQSLVENLFRLTGKKAFYPISDEEVRKYFRRIVEEMSDVERKHCFEHIEQYYRVIKNKIDQLTSKYAEERFFEQRSHNTLTVGPAYQFHQSIVQTDLAPSLGKSLYEREGAASNFELSVLRRILEDDRIRLLWWHRNDSRRGFFINSFINHYPDFLLLTERNTVVALETKGAQLDGSDSEAKIRAGKDWESAANELNDGRKYRYMMVFEETRLQGAYDVAAMLKALSNL